MISYIDPKLLEDYTYKYNDKSDIYSLGVLMWELSSGYPPFINNENENLLRIHLIGGRREEPIPDTPDEYLKLYKLCWDSEPEVRPTISKVFTKLGKMLGIQDDANDDNDNDDNNDIKDSNNEQKNDNNTVYDVHNDCDDLFIPSDDDDQ
ncbi:kinase-like domain-containing protein [Rhizophagus irregularis DAOM 181602=DAOM 197198]|nr:kinase-like domain-containing protein [Rhizophagus irregularis DAOM 181602=DAOM 197198]POG83076.1 kinase-like domain-containing protein [Rhizophagus irregularis DAOM 181602=DAOM 197198]|eukprot:XP_025189942.1 kinase-like domain-containing protein [Rhizophagus irregularis DAOM 181602=DAOM 197198]